MKHTILSLVTLAASFTFLLTVGPFAAHPVDATTVTSADATTVTPIIPKAADDGQIVTIFGKRTVRKKYYSLNNSSARSCGFMASGLSLEIAQPDSEYLRSFHEADQTDNSGYDINGSNKEFSSNAPYGDASRDTPPITLPGLQTYDGSMRPSNCGPSDFGFAAGRAYIAAHDHSLDDAYSAFDGKKYPEAFKLFRASYTKMGFHEAAFMVGKMYLFGVGVAQSTENAIVWLRKVTDSGFMPGTEMRFDPADPESMTVRVDASMTLAKIYMIGYGVPKDPRTAKSWYVKADMFGYIPASYLLGQIYVAGYGGDKNENEALKFFRKAAQAGYAPAQYEMGFAYYTGAYGLSENRKVAAEWLMYSAKGGNPDALYTIGRMYDVGDTLPSDSEKALVYYKEAAIKGQAEAQDAIGLYFYKGETLTKNFAVARQWFTQAAERGNEDAMFNLGVMMAHGEGGPKDLAVAYVWFRLSELSGSDKAEFAAKEIEPTLSADERSRAELAMRPLGAPTTAH